MTYIGVRKISGKRTSTQRAAFLDMVNNPDKYHGIIIYLTAIDEDEVLGLFDTAKRFYYNEQGLWYENDFGIPI